MTVRDGVETDIPAIVEMGREFWKVSGVDEEYDPPSVIGMLHICIAQRLLSVLEVAGHPEGFACGVASPLIANNRVLSGQELAWWVNPRHRKGRNGIKLLKHLEALAGKAGVKYWSMLFMESSMPREVEQIYNCLGYVKSETTHTKVLL